MGISLARGATHLIALLASRYFFWGRYVHIEEKRKRFRARHAVLTSPIPLPALLPAPSLLRRLTPFRATRR